MGRGRKRKFNQNIPAHINQKQLPDNCYWDNGKSPHWYTTYKDNFGKRRRKRIAGKTARLSELHQIIEEYNGIDRNTFRWVSSEYFKSNKFKALAKSTCEDYQYCFDIISQFPTKINKHLADVPLSNWNNPLVQKLVDKLAEHPTKAKHVHNFIRVVFKWGLNRGYVTHNPAIGIDLPKERKLQRLPAQAAYDKLLEHAKANGTHGQKTTGSCPHYIWAIMEIEYLCRLRGVEMRELTDDNLLEHGLIAHRRKGSKTNITEYNKRFNKAIKHLQSCRDKIWSKNKAVYPIAPSDRPLVVNTLGETLKSNAYQSAWQRFITSAIMSGVIDASERFSLHDLKRKGVTDTQGSDDDKMNASGHKDRRMLEVYDKSIPRVKPASE